VVDRLAEQVGDQPEGHGHEVGELDLRHRLGAALGRG
jgi:hypothetical protein